MISEECINFYNSNKDKTWEMVPPIEGDNITVANWILNNVDFGWIVLDAAPKILVEMVVVMLGFWIATE